ncbi:hypothetical protein ACIOEX_06945 [Streptomyces sp. NPDC087850]|uniref:hypothetical protein n=1 Tax=unclassified Streptomyces TaxID=2593676 RepID=UPI003809564C
MDTSLMVRRFPLVARPRPACTPIAERVREIGALAREADRDQRPAPAAAVFNKSALLASDCDLPQLARSLCWRHSEAYLRTQPLGAQVARYGLEPLVNLSRLLTRAGDGEAAYRLLDSMLQATRTRSDLVIDGRTVSFGHIEGSNGELHDLHQWLWMVLLADGTRALASTGKWSAALTQLQRHRGIGGRMLDGRQVAVIARFTEGHVDDALAVLEETTPADPWEKAVTACLDVMCRRHAGMPVEREIARLVDCYQRLDKTVELAVFHARLGLSVADVVTGVDESLADRVAADLLRDASVGNDGYVAREVLAHVRSSKLLTSRQTRQLTELVDSCALGLGSIPAALLTALNAALDMAEGVLGRMMSAPTVS